MGYEMKESNQRPVTAKSASASLVYPAILVVYPHTDTRVGVGSSVPILLVDWKAMTTQLSFFAKTYGGERSKLDETIL
jgi:hypothetical protein